MSTTDTEDISCLSGAELKSQVMTIPLQLPLLGLETLRAILGRTEDQVIALIEDGSLRWAFDLSVPPSRRRLIRVWAMSVHAFLNPMGSFPKPGTARAVASLLLPECYPPSSISAVALTRIFNVASQHVTSLARAGALRSVSGCQWRQGRGGSPVFYHSTVIGFLESRVIQ